MLASEELGIPIDKITLKWGDTDLVPEGGGTGGSRSLQQGGAAVQQASQELIEVARERAAAELEANPADLVFDVVAQRVRGGRRPGRGGPAGRRWPQTERLLVRAVFTAPGATYPFGSHVAVVDVDTETGKVVLRRLITVDDAGIVLNPLLAEGQRHGGIAQGAAQALCEEFVYDADGNPLTASFADYPFLSATEVPSFELADMVTPTSYNPLGAKGIGEAGTIGATPAVQNAVVDAVAHLGVRHIDMPTSSRAGLGRAAGRADWSVIGIGERVMQVKLTVNGEPRSADVEPRLLLVHYLREHLGLRAANVGCDTTSCGACTVLLDGTVGEVVHRADRAGGGPRRSSRPRAWAEGREAGGELHPVQAAFRQEHGLQCGFCTPGMVMAATALLAENPHPTETQVREGLEGNLCRCTGYHNIVRAVLSAAEAGAGTQPPASAAGADQQADQQVADAADSEVAR